MLRSLSNIFIVLFKLVCKDKFAVMRRVCVDREGMKFTKKSWTKGLTAAEINILIGKCKNS